MIQGRRKEKGTSGGKRVKKGKRGGRWKESRSKNRCLCVAELDLAQDAVVDATLLRVVVLVECSTHDRVVIDHNSVPTFCWLGRVELILELYTKLPTRA